MLRLFEIELQLIRNRLLSLKFSDEAKAAFFTLMGVFFLVFIYAGGYRLLSYMNSVAVIGPLLVNKLVALIFLISFSMIIFSSTITAFSTMFASKDLPWLIQKPIKIEKIFFYKAISTAVYSSWMAVLLILPVLIALFKVKGVSVWGIAASFSAVLPFVFLSSFLGIVIAMVVVHFVPYRQSRDIFLLAGILLTTVMYMLFRFIEPEKFVRPDGMELVSQYLQFLSAPTVAYLPSWWVTGGIFAAIKGDISLFVFYFFVIIVALCAISALLLMMARYYYFEGWVQNQIIVRKTSPLRTLSSKRSAFFAMVQKDFTIFFRDASQWSQVLLLGSLVIVYLFSIYKLPLDSMYLQNLVVFLNIGLIGFILAAVALRFVFPSISMESESFWIIKTAPIRLRSFLLGKLFYGGVPVLALGLILSVFSALLLKADKQIVIITVSAVVCMAMVISSMALSFGSIFPKFGSYNIIQVESSQGGILFMVFALFYIGVDLALLALPVQQFYFGKFGLAFGYSKTVPLSVLSFAAVNIVFFALSFWAGLRSLERIER